MSSFLPISFNRARIKGVLITTLLLLSLSFLGCSRSPWVKTDGHEATPSDELECVKTVHDQAGDEVLDQDVIETRVEQCMLDRGYKRRPWWLMNDLHWHIKEPAM